MQIRVVSDLLGGLGFYQPECRKASHPVPSSLVSSSDPDIHFLMCLKQHAELDSRVYLQRVMYQD